MRLVLCVVSVLNLGVVVPVAGQRLGTEFVRWEPPAVSAARAERWNAYPRKAEPGARGDYRYEGLAFGSVVFGALGAWVGSRLSGGCPTVPGADCDTDRLGNAVALGLVSAAAGGALGYVVGRLSPKVDAVRPPLIQTGPSTGVPDSTRRVVGYRQWKGAAIGSGTGAAIGALLALLSSNTCSDCDVTEGDFLKVSLVSAGIGGVFGFMVGLASPKYESPPAEAGSE